MVLLDEVEYSEVIVLRHVYHYHLLRLRLSYHEFKGCLVNPGLEGYVGDFTFDLEMALLSVVEELLAIPLLKTISKVRSSNQW